jgi:pimeloyl-ACP methyl ester carboxylesterase
MVSPMTNADGETPPTRDRTVDIAVEGQHIEGTVVAPDPSTPGVLFVHGWGGSQNHYLARAREIAQLGCVCLTFDLRGHGSTQEQQHTVTRLGEGRLATGGPRCPPRARPAPSRSPSSREPSYRPAAKTASRARGRRLR